MNTWCVTFYSGAKMTVKSKDYFGAKGKVEGYIKSCSNKPKLYSIVIC